MNEREKTLHYKKYSHFVTKKISKGEEVSRSLEGLYVGLPLYIRFYYSFYLLYTYVNKEQHILK